MSGASRHWPDVREVMAMELLSCRITGTEIRDRQNIHHMLDTVSLVVHCVTYRISVVYFCWNFLCCGISSPNRITDRGLVMQTYSNVLLPILQMGICIVVL